MLSLEGRISDEVRMALTPASAEPVGQLRETFAVLQDLRAELAVAVQ
ncbi:hypothetical protein [Paraburkholderia franconis]|nr:hypothetical protein [Paraburkholderia franconis]